MTHNIPTNIVASVRQKLLNIIRETGDDPNYIWTRFAMERLIYRISVSEYSANLILKGALLFLLWRNQTYRPTLDADFSGLIDDSIEITTKIFRRICHIKVEPDGLIFDSGTVTAIPIRQDLEYHGQRVTLSAFLGKARIPLQIDIGFGDVITPKAKRSSFPTLLDFPPPRILTCPKETVIAEKLQAMIMLGIANSRMKDFYDIFVLEKDFAFLGNTLVQAIKATFNRRKTEIPTDIPLALSEEFAHDRVKTAQWNAFLQKNGLTDVPEFPEILAKLRNFLMPILRAAADIQIKLGKWNPGGPWHCEN